MLTRDQVRNLRENLQEHLDELNEQLGYKLTLGSCSYGGNIATFKLECAALNDDGGSETKQQQDFRLNADRFGVPANALGYSFSFRGKTYKIVGMKPRSYKWPFLAEDANGRVFKFPPEIIKSSLESLKTSQKKGKR